MIGQRFYRLMVCPKASERTMHYSALPAYAAQRCVPKFLVADSPVCRMRNIPTQWKLARTAYQEVIYLAVQVRRNPQLMMVAPEPFEPILFLQRLLGKSFPGLAHSQKRQATGRRMKCPSCKMRWSRWRKNYMSRRPGIDQCNC
jgi:hypothetical protein